MRKYRIRKEPKHPNSTALPGYFLDDIYEGGDVFDSYPEYYCDMLNSESKEFIYSIEEFADGARETPSTVGSGNYGAAREGQLRKAPTKINRSSGAFAGHG